MATKAFTSLKPLNHNVWSWLGHPNPAESCRVMSAKLVQHLHIETHINRSLKSVLTRVDWLWIRVASCDKSSFQPPWLQKTVVFQPSFNLFKLETHWKMLWLACFSHSMAPLGSADASGQRAHDAPKHVHAQRPKKCLANAVILGRESSGGGNLGQFIRFWGSTKMCDDFWPHVYARWIVKAQARTRTPISSYAWRDTTVKLSKHRCVFEMASGMFTVSIFADMCGSGLQGFVVEAPEAPAGSRGPPDSEGAMRCFVGALKRVMCM